MTDQRLQELAKKWEAKTISESEMQEFLNWCSSHPEAEILISPNIATSKEQLEKKLFAAITNKIHEHPFAPKRFAWIKYAAAILLLIAVGAFYLLFNQSDNKQYAENKVDLISPVTNKAILTLSDGRKIDLNDKTSQQLSDGNAKIQKKDGIISYEIGFTTDNTNRGYNYLVTPRGGQYQIVLPDGSKVWLNSASSLRYPVVFDQNSRTVELDGEAYFDIKQNKSAPFMVKTRKLNINVLGTGFNINSYEDETNVAATLVQGSIQVFTENNESSILKPGQQATLPINSTKLIIAKPDLEQVLAWKEGKLKFQSVNIQTIMRQIARWYDVQIEYSGKISEVGFNGSILKTESPKTLLEVFELTNEIHFEVVGKKIIVIAGAKPKLNNSK